MSWEMAIAATLLISAGSAAFIAWPLLVGRPQPGELSESDSGEPVLQRLLSQRDATFATIRELEFDFAMGGLSPSEFEELRQRYKRKAAAILKRIEDLTSGRSSPGPVAREDEQELSAKPEARNGRTMVQRPAERLELDLEQEIEAHRRGARGLSQTGGAAVPSTSGSKAAEAARARCPSCGRTIQDPEASFCGRCGAPIRPGTRRARKKTRHHGVDRHA